MKSPEPPQPKSEAIGVLTLREAATRLGMSTDEMEAMVATGAVKSVVVGWTTNDRVERGYEVTGE